MARYALWPRRPAASTATLDDTAGHRLGVLGERLRELQAQDEQADLFSLERELRAALHEVRFTTPGYRPLPLSAALERTAETLRAVGIELEIVSAVATAPGLGTAPGIGAAPDDWAPQVSAALGWVLRECTANILRHSTARRVWISLTPTSEGLRLAIRNNGVAKIRPGTWNKASEPGSGSGIPSMLAQVSVMGGTLRVDRTDTRFELVAVVPTNPRPSMHTQAGRR
ncbi:sensor histidine kinase [Kitasatospora sp. McL0602]|uniref:sensor histidine kinase n=1 Tax=Kitasatospora sp. McL0602 TaxID=3439530 RepID=UPI003F8B23C1